MGCISGSATVHSINPAFEENNESIGVTSQSDKNKQIDDFVNETINISTSKFSD